MSTIYRSQLGSQIPSTAQGQSPDHVAGDETMIQLNNERYCLYAVLRMANFF
jgi:hypothetical protein